MNLNFLIFKFLVKDHQHANLWLKLLLLKLPWLKHLWLKLWKKQQWPLFLVASGIPQLDGQDHAPFSTEALTMEMGIFSMKDLWQRPTLPLDWGR